MWEGMVFPWRTEGYGPLAAFPSGGGRELQGWHFPAQTSDRSSRFVGDEVGGERGGREQPLSRRSQEM